ncbi:MAG: ribose-phosphate diphosphokinase [Candidatus Promineifilaceae bacterium]|nr:ribose-phosphate diphosphokinase [Candidatus Promineifilaceae bacterium]
MTDLPVTKREREAEATEKRAVAEERSPRGDLMIASCRSGLPLARRIVERLRVREEAERGDGERGTEVGFLEGIDTQFSDTETVVRLDADVSGKDVFLLQALYDPTSERGIDENYMAFFTAARACREWGANHVTAILPYLAYARQDKPSLSRREPTTAKLTADFAIAAGIDRLITWHPHLRQIHGFYGGTPLHVLDALGFFVEAYREYDGREDVIMVAPDAGATKFVMACGRALDLSCAVGSKYRPRPEEAVLTDVMGDTAGKRVAIVIDDMISSGGTAEALIQKLIEETEIEEVHLGVSHNLCLPAARERLEELHQAYHLQEVMVTNTIPQTEAFRSLPFLDVRDLSDVLADVILRVHHNRPVSEMYQRIE